MDNIDKTKTNNETLSRRKALSRIGLFVAAAYSIPAFTTLSMARASSGTSGTSTSDGASSSGASSGASSSGASSGSSDVSGASLSITSEVEDLCGEDGDLANAEDVQCLVDNGVILPEDFVVPEGVILPVL
ncbi:hypothetical protein A9Q96_14485 [Rhodobacterales bacterium 52_120_T64]|nr:hypothetical protein A9Q96_14485 [Rhodobacterales bacterium 52_120_T64]